MQKLFLIGQLINSNPVVRFFKFVNIIAIDLDLWAFLYVALIGDI